MKVPILQDAFEWEFWSLESPFTNALGSWHNNATSSSVNMQYGEVCQALSDTFQMRGLAGNTIRLEKTSPQVTGL
jgi:hypothetical protein